MNPLIAKRKNKSGTNIEKDYFIYGIYPNKLSLLINNHAINSDDYSRTSFNIRYKSQNPIIISHNENSSSQLELILYVNDGVLEPFFIRKLYYEKNDFQIKEIYMKQLLQIFPIPKPIPQNSQPYVISNRKISSFSIKDESLVLTEIQYKWANNALQILSQNSHGIFEVYIYNSNFDDLCFIPAFILHLYRENHFNGPFLIVVKSEETVDYLFNLFNKWTILKTLVILGNDEVLEMLEQFAFPFSPKKMYSVKFHVVLTTHSAFERTLNFFIIFPWNLIVFFDDVKNYSKIMMKFSHFAINIIGVIE